MNLLLDVWAARRIWVTVIAFLAPLKLAVDYDPELEKVSKCAYGIFVMVILWVTEAVPIPVTALLPIFLFPMLGVATAGEMSGTYITDTSMLFFGGLVVAVAIEESGLHKRISLIVMRIVGAKPRWLMLGLMITTWFLSMWISNTAATAMMVPIITAVIETVRDVKKSAHGVVNEAYQVDTDANGDVKLEKVKSSQNGSGEVNTDTVEPSQIDIEVGPPKPSTLCDCSEVTRLSKAFALSVAYGANVGGIATLTGTPPNLVLKGNVDELYATGSGIKDIEGPISFANWMGFAFPMSLITMLLCWGWLQLLYLCCGCIDKANASERRAINKVIIDRFRALGLITFAEIEVLIVFVLLVCLWLFRAPPNIEGWGVLFNEGDKKYVSDSTPVILLSVLLFILPRDNPLVYCRDDRERKRYKPILSWKVVSGRLSWGVIVLLGGGFALAKASQLSGLSAWIGTKLERLDDLNEVSLTLIIAVVVAAMTELTSNTATATLLMPIMSAVAIQIGTHPLLLMIAATIACSFAFMLPVATPPNAIVFSTGYVRVIDMVIAGLPMNIIAVLSLTLALNTWGKSMYNLDDIPEIFRKVTTLAPNITTVMTTTP